MSKFKFVKNVEGWRGVVKAYRHEDHGQEIAVSRAFTFDRGDETMIFKYDVKNEKVLDWTDLYAGYGETHEEALSNWEEESLLDDEDGDDYDW